MDSESACRMTARRRRAAILSSLFSDTSQVRSQVTEISGSQGPIGPGHGSGTGAAGPVTGPGSQGLGVRRPPG